MKYRYYVGGGGEAHVVFEQVRNAKQTMERWMDGRTDAKRGHGVMVAINLLCLLGGLCVWRWVEASGKLFV